MRRRLALLVAATTSVVLLAFTLPLAVQIDRGRDERGHRAATDRSQRIVPPAADGLGDRDQGGRVATVSGPATSCASRWPTGAVVGRPFRTASLPSTLPRATAVAGARRRPGDLDQPVVREDGTAVSAP